MGRVSQPELSGAQPKAGVSFNRAPIARAPCCRQQPRGTVQPMVRAVKPAPALPPTGIRQPPPMAASQRLQPPARPAQAKNSNGRQAPLPAQHRSVPAAPPAYRPQPVKRVLQSKVNNGLPQVVKSATSQTRAATAGTPPGSQRRIVQPFASRIVQATKFYPNLHPGAVEPVDRSNVFKLASFADQYRLHKVNSHGVNVPNQQYNFVRTREGEMLLHSRYRHPSIAEGKQVLYAGEIFFNNGKLQWWSNGSGHYQPYVEDAVQANLPMDHFYSYQQVIKGEHTRKKG